MDGHDYHACACRGCEPALVEEGPRQGEGHIGVRFHDMHQTWEITIDGRGGMERGAVEALAGSPGWILAFCEPIHICKRCRKGACVERLVGRVTIARRGWVPA